MKPVLLAALALASIASAQRGLVPGVPAGIPAGTPTVNHPALAGQPLIQPDNRSARPAPSTTAPGKAARARPKPKPVDPATVGPKASGSELKKKIDKVVKLEWRKSMSDLEARSAATGKPILYLQALGSLSGYA